MFPPISPPDFPKYLISAGIFRSVSQYVTSISTRRNFSFSLHSTPLRSPHAGFVISTSICTRRFCLLRFSGFISVLLVDYKTIFIFLLLMFLDNGLAAGMGLILVTLDVKNLGTMTLKREEMQRRIMLNLYLMNFSSNSRFN
ncbi:hypothetical protein ZOSMA_239G00160 [Zostera marina]|uniref:Uncharacterized protein n=1 Tax=Zostera marina TaxID=29655 RepID=A0A0K9PJU6_ZOSMR|nr:hypothetical protein ZOSMA_239G00160 [Zostera marina]